MAKDCSPMHKMENFLLVLLGAGLALDVPSSRAYNEYEAWTEVLGKFLFHGFKDLYGIPLPFTLFEILSYLSFLAVLMTFGLQWTKQWKLMAALALILPGAGVIGTISGELRGNAMTLALTQLHVVPLISVWLGLGYFMGLRPGNDLRIFRVIFHASLFKAVYALYVYIAIYEMRMGEREFLIDHPTSIYLVCGMIYAVWQLLRRDLGLLRKSLFLAALIGQATAYVLNDRRASFTGALIAILLLPWILPRRLRIGLGPLYRKCFGVGLIVAFLFALEASNPYSFIGGFKSEILSSESLTYRHIENFNLLSGVINAPWLGLGFGTEYPQVMKLPDISRTFPLFAAIPHNTLYFLWTFAGPLGIAGFCTFSCVVLVLITRCGCWARSSSQLFYAILALFLCAQWISFVFFDMGLLEVRSHMVFGLVIGSLFPQYARHIMEYVNENSSKSVSFVTESLALPLHHDNSGK